MRRKYTNPNPIGGGWLGPELKKSRRWRRCVSCRDEFSKEKVWESSKWGYCGTTMRTWTDRMYCCTGCAPTREDAIEAFKKANKPPGDMRH